jgi:hypothetical protein
LRLRDEVRDAYVNEHGGTIPGTKGVGDLRMTLEDLVATRGSRVLVRMREGNDQLEWRLDEREAIATLNGRVLLRSGTGILANTAHTLTLSNYDDRMSIEGVGEVLQGDYHGGLTRGPRENEVEIVVEGPALSSGGCASIGTSTTRRRGAWASKPSTPWMTTATSCSGTTRATAGTAAPGET